MHSPELVIVGRIRTAHGIKGEVLVEALTDTPDAVFASGRRVYAGTVGGDPDPEAGTLHVERSRPFKAGWLIRFAEIADRSAAEAWRARHLLLPETELEPPAEGETFIHDLLGLRVEHVSGATLGTVTDVFELPQGLMLEVETGSGRAMIPFREEIITEVSLARGVVVVDPPAGLLD